MSLDETVPLLSVAGLRIVKNRYPGHARGVDCRGGHHRLPVDVAGQAHRTITVPAHSTHRKRGDQKGVRRSPHRGR